MYPILWALKHAPCADVYEQMILMQMADSTDEDGCNAYLSKDTIADRIAGDIDPETVRRKWLAMQRRGLIRLDTTPPPERYLRIPKQYRTKRWELCIPYSWWSDAQRERIQQGRDDRGLGPLTPESRPDLAPAPPKPSRSDKGKPRPKKKTAKTGATLSAPSRKTDPTDSAPSKKAPGATESGSQGPLPVAPRGHSQRPNHLFNHPQVPSSLPVAPAPEGAHVEPSRPSGREDESSNDTNNDSTPLGEALSIVDAAVRLWPRGCKAPGANDRQRLAERVVAELAGGGDEQLILHELSRDMSDVGDAMRVMMGARTKTPGWGRNPDPRPDYAQYEVTVKHPWCGQCGEKTRMVQVLVDPISGETQPKRCSTPVIDHDGQRVACHPQGKLVEAFPEEPVDVAPAPAAESLDDASLKARRAREEALAAVKAQFASVKSGAEHEQKTRIGSRR